MKPQDFITAYEKALATQDWNLVKPLILDNASVSFSDGSVHRGIYQIEKAFVRNFTLIKSEKFTIDNVHWVSTKADYAVYTFEYQWSGIINGNLLSGSGIGTSILTNEDGQWKLLSEHLGRKAE